MLLALLALTGCGKKKNFTVKGEIEGIGSQLITATYYSAGGLKRITVMPADGRFGFHGEASRPTLLTVNLADGTTLATLVVENGDKISLTGNAARPFEIEVDGNGDSEKIARWVNDNARLLEARDAEAINRSLARWISDNRSSKASTALMVTYFYTPGYEHLADSLMTMLSTSARAQDVVQNFTGVLAAQLGDAESAKVGSLNLYDVSDSIISVNPYRHSATLICFMASDREARDSVRPCIARLFKSYGMQRFNAVEISSAPDSAAWRQSLAGDTVTWRRTWAPATVASTSLRKFAVPRFPYFIVADSAGTQIYRGGSITLAAQTIEKKLDKK